MTSKPVKPSKLLQYIILLETHSSGVNTSNHPISPTYLTRYRQICYYRAGSPGPGAVGCRRRRRRRRWLVSEDPLLYVRSYAFGLGFLLLFFSLLAYSVGWLVDWLPAISPEQLARYQQLTASSSGRGCVYDQSCLNFDGILMLNKHSPLDPGILLSRSKRHGGDGDVWNDDVLGINY